ncbi:hypothetical protein [Streptomyces sp. NPDC085540]|uniref:hypothetical protein n=1 Tax=Streptomyces sp. NPDC085540 TaxID=3365730 RepID=UPI0037CF0928
MTAVDQVATLAMFGSVRPVLSVGHNLEDHVIGHADHQVAVEAAPSATEVAEAAEAAGLDRTRLAEAALHSAETRADPKGACDALLALGAAALTLEQYDRLAALATGDRRLVVSWFDHSMIREDEQLRAALASVL